MRLLTVSILTLSLGLILALPATAAEPSPETAVKADAAAPLSPKERVENTYAFIAEAAAKAETQDEMVDALHTKLKDLMDYTAFAERTLRRSWPDLTPEQRALFMDRFEKMVVKVYARRFKPKTEFEVAYRRPVKVKPDGKMAKVYSTVKGSELTADVDYYFTLGDSKGDPRWFVYDFEIDMVSMALNWRKQFERIIAEDGFDALIAKMETRIERDSDDAEDAED